MNREEPLIPVLDTQRLHVLPIWDYPVDPHEGRLYAAYIAKNPSYEFVYVRKTVAIMLQQAAELLPKHVVLIIRAGHRPLSVQKEVLEMVKADYLIRNPEATETEALQFARTFVSDPRIKVPPHCCGAAVDVDALDTRTNQLVDFGCAVNTDDEIASLGTSRISNVQASNRSMLHEAMIAVGFAPFEHEWWHFSYRDQTWADFYKKTDTLYEIIEP